MSIIKLPTYLKLAKLQAGAFKAPDDSREGGYVVSDVCGV
jgi:hypothetical protein